MFFIIGCARSGTTAIAKILDCCKNVNVGIELKPNLCIESRDFFDGNLKKNPKEILIESRRKQIIEAHNSDKIFADKNVNYLLYRMWSGSPSVYSTFSNEFCDSHSFFNSSAIFEIINNVITPLNIIHESFNLTYDLIFIIVIVFIAGIAAALLPAIKASQISVANQLSKNI